MSHQQVLPSVKHESNPNSAHNLSGEEWAVTQTKQKLPNTYHQYTLQELQ